MDKEKFKKYLPYIGISGGVLGALLLLFILIDWVILPWMILDDESVTVPNVIGKKYSQAQTILEDEGLNYKRFIEQFSDDHPINTVINQSPKPNTVVKSGRHILLTVSKGGEAVSMPDIIRKPLRTARVELMKVGLYIGNIEYNFHDSIGPDSVISQSIRGGNDITFGSSVNLVISKGSEANLTVPNLVGNTIAEVEDILFEYELQLGAVSNAYDEVYSTTYMRNTVVSQFPKAGDKVAKNTKIDITIFR
jgi:serine/threonine-protein kinase